MGLAVLGRHDVRSDHVLVRAGDRIRIEPDQGARNLRFDHAKTIYAEFLRTTARSAYSAITANSVRQATQDLLAIPGETSAVHDQRVAGDVPALIAG